MSKDKDTLPMVDSLKDFGFQFEYSRISDAVFSIKDFVKDNFKVLQDLYFFDNVNNHPISYILMARIVTNMRNQL
jgi:hypothetical protein